MRDFKQGAYFRPRQILETLRRHEDGVSEYDYEDMVDAQYRLVKEGLGIKHLRLVIGNSMGGMHSWIWGVKYPQAMDALVPMASQPTEMASRNWMLRRMMLETIRNDPDYNGGNYNAQPRTMKYAINASGIATGGGTLAYQMLAPTAAKAMPTTSSTNGKPRAITIPPPDWSGSKPRCSRSTPTTTNAIRRKPA
jgi:homoserine acetyltransferase